MAFDWSAFWSACLGGAFTLGGTLWGARLQRKHQLDVDLRGAETELRGFLGAIHAEMTVLWERYSESAQQHIWDIEDGSLFTGEWPVYQDYFTVYTQNASLIGRIEDADLRTSIVRAYTLAKGMVDSFRFNSELIQRLTELRATAAAAGGNIVASYHADQVEREAIQYAQSIRAWDAPLEREVTGLLRRIELRLNL